MNDEVEIINHVSRQLFTC